MPAETDFGIELNNCGVSLSFRVTASGTSFNHLSSHCRQPWPSLWCYSIVQHLQLVWTVDIVKMIHLSLPNLHVNIKSGSQSLAHLRNECFFDSFSWQLISEEIFCSPTCRVLLINIELSRSKDPLERNFKSH